MPSDRNLRAAREPAQRVQYALHENHEIWPARWDRSFWDAEVARRDAARGPRANCYGEFSAGDDGRLQDSERDRVAAAPSQRVAQGGEARTAEIVVRMERWSLHRGRPGHAAIRIHVAAFSREGSRRAAVFAAAGAGLLRFRGYVRHGNQLSGTEDGAVGALPQNLAASAGNFHDWKPRGIRIHAGASRAALIRRISRRRVECNRSKMAAQIFLTRLIVNVKGSDRT